MVEIVMSYVDMKDSSEEYSLLLSYLCVILQINK